MKKLNMRSLMGLVSLGVVTVFLWIVLGIDLTHGAGNYYSGKPAKYIFFFIGDGMGASQRDLAAAFAGKELVMNTLPAQGLTTTCAQNRYITDSAAAVTALACGKKTNVKMIGLDPDGKPLETIAELAKKRGLKVGIISSAPIDHATPAGFYAHVPSRYQFYDIDVAIAESGFDFFGGGGLVDPDNRRTKSKQFKGDARELMKTAGYRFINKRDELMSLKPGDDKVYAFNKRLTEKFAMPYAMDMDGREDISLAELTDAAVRFLENEKGFFVVVEGGKIDWACHANDAATSVHDTIAFDEAIEKAVEFWKKHPAETLIVVTGDHETGGMSLGSYGTQYETGFELLSLQKISSERFVGEVLKSYKKACKEFCHFETVRPLITEYFGLKFGGDTNDPLVLNEHEVKRIKRAYELSMAFDKPVMKNFKNYVRYGENDPLTVTLTQILNNKAGIGWTSFSHTGAAVVTSAAGVGSHLFNGRYDNTEIALKIMSIMGEEPKARYRHEPAKAAGRSVPVPVAATGQRAAGTH